MAHDNKASMEQMPQQMRETAEKSLAEAKRALDQYMSAAKQAATSIEGSMQAAQTSATDVSKQAMSFAEANVQAAFDFAGKLVRAKDPKEMVSINQDFARTQLEQFNRQMRELGNTATGQNR